MITRTTRRAVFAAAVASATLGLMSVSVARADGDQEVSSVKVNFGDLDVSTMKGSKTLYLRLQNAANDVCGDTVGILSFPELRQIRRCDQEAIESAVARVDRPLLTALYDRHFPHDQLVGGSRVSYAPGEVSAPLRVEVINVAARRG